MTDDSLSVRFAGHMGRLLGPEFPTSVGLAVSGGADSMAMLVLAHEWARVYGVRLQVATVDHRLREGSADEAAIVAAECAKMGHSHYTLHWYWDRKGNLQDAARRARLELVSAWRGDTDHVMLGHTQNDQAETLLMRLARGSGVEGLAAMAEVRTMPGGWQLVRPLLTETRADLRHHLDVLQVPYFDDPSNDDDTFGRVRMRKAIACLGLDVGGLAETATRMGRAEVALAARAVSVAQGCMREETWGGLATGDLLIDRDAFALIERDTQLRLLAAAMQWIASADYRPRAAALEGVLNRALAGGGGTLHGCQVIVSADSLRVCREYRAVEEVSVPLDGVTTWDNRWQISSPEQAGLSISALGPEGWKQLPLKPTGGQPFEAAIARPALFDGPQLIACDLTTFGPEFEVSLVPKRGSFIASLESR